MFLCEQNILECLSQGDLVIDPAPHEMQWGALALDLRLGTQFLQLQRTHRMAPFDLTTPSSALFSSKDSTAVTVPLGESLLVSPGTTLVAATLEYVHMPRYLAGFLFPRSALERVGLSVAPGTIDPGFRGKLTLVLRNTNCVPVILRPGLRVTRLYLAGLRQVPSREYVNHSLAYSSEIAEIESLKATLDEVAPKRSPEAVSAQLLATRLSEVLTTEGRNKGKALEELVADLFTSLEGLRILKRNACLSAEELDLVIRNDLTTGFWRIAGSPLIVECKNWSGKVGAREISVLVDKLQALSPDARAGILVAINGITGDSYSDAMLKIREARQRGRYVLVIERKDLEEAVSGVSLAQVIENKYEAMVLI